MNILAYPRRVVFTENNIAPHLPEGYSFVPGLHREIGSGSGNFVPMYIEPHALPMPKETPFNTKRRVKNPLDFVYKCQVPKGSLAQARGIRHIEVPYSVFLKAKITNLTIPFVAVRKGKKIIGRALDNPNGPPSSFHWEDVSRGIRDIPLFSKEFGQQVKEHVKALDPGAKVLVVGSSFGKPLIELKTEFPEIDFKGLDVHDWIHALPEVEKGFSDSEIEFIRNNTIIADASPETDANPKKGRSTAIPFKPRKYDLVVMHPHSFEYFQHPLDAVAELFRITKKNGKVLGHFGTPSRYYICKGASLTPISFENVMRDYFNADVSVRQTFNDKTNARLAAKKIASTPEKSIMIMAKGKAKPPEHIIIQLPHKDEKLEDYKRFAVNNDLQDTSILLRPLAEKRDTKGKR